MAVTLIQSPESLFKILRKREALKTVIINIKHEIFRRGMCKMRYITFCVGIKGETLMSTDLKFSLITTLIVLSVIVAVD